MELTLNCDLAIEVTRECQFECEHCCRGEREGKIFNPDWLLPFIENTKLRYVPTLTFTGGEPSLVPDIIIQCMSILKDREVDVGNFYIATNGFNISMDFIRAIFYLYEHCDDNEYSTVDFSNSPVHEYEWESKGKIFPKEIPAPLSILKIVGTKYNNRSSNFWGGVIQEGRGADGGERSPDLLAPIEFECDDGYWHTDDELLYLNCEGYVIPGCNYSYDTQREEEYQISKISDFNMYKMMEWNNNFEREKA